jgi:hypothetical protein
MQNTTLNKLEDKEEESQKYGASSYWDDYGMEKKTMKI